jgi:hypothetical protein
MTIHKVNNKSGKIIRAGLSVGKNIITTPNTEIIQVSQTSKLRKGLGRNVQPSSIDGDSLQTNLISYWNLNESAGTRNDTFGANNLTQIGSVGNSFDAASFNNSASNRLAKTSNSSLQINGSSFTVCLWVWLRTKTNYRPFITKDDIGSSREFSVVYTQSEGGISDRIVLNVFNLAVGTGGVSLPANNYGSPQTEQWLFVVAEYDSVNNLAYIAINNATRNSASTTGISVGAGSADLTFGAWSGGVLSLTHDGGVRQAGLWKRLLTTDEKTWLYNNRLGRYYLNGSFQ